MFGKNKIKQNIKNKKRKYEMGVIGECRWS